MNVWGKQQRTNPLSHCLAWKPLESVILSHNAELMTVWRSWDDKNQDLKSCPSFVFSKPVVLFLLVLFCLKRPPPTFWHLEIFIQPEVVKGPLLKIALMIVKSELELSWIYVNVRKCQHSKICYWNVQIVHISVGVFVVPESKLSIINRIHNILVYITWGITYNSDIMQRTDTHLDLFTIFFMSPNSNNDSMMNWQLILKREICEIFSAWFKINLRQWIWEIWLIIEYTKTWE